MIEIKTRFGSIKVKLYDETPLHKANFIKLAKEGFYNESLFHRVIPNFMIQGGDPNSKPDGQGRVGTGGPGYTIPAEINSAFNHKKGALAAARLGDQMNPKRASSGSQFYIVNANSGAHFLNGQYTIFGEVLEGLDVVDKISALKTDASDNPIESVAMEVIFTEEVTAE
jgi:cyclophilin family peptidyl-prolyl cis-trans isomerase